MKELLERTNLANLAAFILIIGGMIFAIVTQNKDMMQMLVGAGIGYLFKRM